MRVNLQTSIFQKHIKKSFSFCLYFCALITLGGCFPDVSPDPILNPERDETRAARKPKITTHDNQLIFADAFNTQGTNITVNWLAITSVKNIVDHRIQIFSDSNCLGTPVQDVLTGSIYNINNSSVSFTTGDDGVFYGKVNAITSSGVEFTGPCSTDTLIFDSTPPTVLGTKVDFQFTNVADGDGNDIAVSWNAFFDLYLFDHELFTYTNSSCSAGEVNHGKTGSNTSSNLVKIDNLTDGTYWGKVKAYDSHELSTLSECSQDSIIVDTINPVKNASLTVPLFTADGDSDGLNMAMTWNAFSDTNLANHQIYSYKGDNTCTSTDSAVVTDHGLTGDNTNSNSIIVDVLTEGTYYARIKAIDIAGNETVSACSADSIIVDKTLPEGTGVSFTFDDPIVTSGDNLNVRWNSFVETNLRNFRIYTYKGDATCTSTDPSIVTDHGLTGNTNLTNSTIVDVATDGKYYGVVAAIDVADNVGRSPCSTSFVYVDNNDPTDNGAKPTFTQESDADGDNVAITWTPFTDANLDHYQVKTFTDNGCTTSSGVTHPVTTDTTPSTTISNLPDGTYFATVTAFDAVGKSTPSACSYLNTNNATVDVGEAIIIDSVLPDINGSTIAFDNLGNKTGSNVAVTWGAFSDNNLKEYRLYTFKDDSTCTSTDPNVVTDHGLTGDLTLTNNTLIAGLDEGTYYAVVAGRDKAGNEQKGPCSGASEKIIIDKTPPVDNTANIQFPGAPVDAGNDGNGVVLNWTAFTDDYLTDHQVITFSDSACATPTGVNANSGNNSNTITLNGLPEGTIFAKVKAIDIAGNETESACSTSSIIVDFLPPDNTGVDFTFTDSGDGDGDNIRVLWNAFSDTLLSNYELFTYKGDNTCTSIDPAVVKNHGKTGSLSTGNQTQIDGLDDGTYYGKVVAYDLAGKSTSSNCSSANGESIIVDKTFPKTPAGDNKANLKFSEDFDADGNNIEVTWTAFDDANIKEYQVETFRDSPNCTLNRGEHAKTGSATPSAIINVGQNNGVFYAKVTAFDIAGNSVTSICGDDFITVNTAIPIRIVSSDDSNDYGTPLVNTSKTLRVINSTGADVAVTTNALTLSPANSPFTISADNCNATNIPQNNECTIIVDFDGASGVGTGTYTATITVNYPTGSETLTLSGSLP